MNPKIGFATKYTCRDIYFSIKSQHKRISAIYKERVKIREQGAHESFF